MNAADFPKHTGRVTPQVRRHTHIMRGCRLLAIFGQAVNPYATFKVDGIHAD